MKITRLFSATFAVIMALSVILFAPLAAASDGTAYQLHQWPAHMQMPDDVTATRSNVLFGGGAYAIVEPDSALPAPKVHPEASISLFDITALRKMNWSTRHKVKRSFLHSLGNNRAVVGDRRPAVLA